MTSFERPAERITMFTNIAPVMPEESLVLPQAEAQPSTFRRWISRVAMVGALVSGGFAVEAATDALSSRAASPTCYGDYCSGKYAADTGCDKDAKTITSTPISKSTLGVAVQVGPVSVSGGGSSVAIGILELRRSEKCGTSWSRLSTNQASDINYVGVQHDGGYTKKRKISGRYNGSPAAVSTSPMVYGRSRGFRGIVDTYQFPLPVRQNGTDWKVVK